MGISGGSNIGELKANKDVEGLIKALKDKDWHVRIPTVGALGEIRDKRAIEPLTQALKDENSIVRSLAEEALEKIKGR